MNLRDQLKKANLISDKKAKQLAHQQRVERKEKGREQLEQEVTIKAFCDRYEWISAIFDGNDDDFVEMMKAAWRLC